MHYRVYAEDVRGYILKGNFVLDDLFFMLDELIIGNNANKKILVIEHDDELNSDTPYFLYDGDINYYLDFKKERCMNRTVSVKEKVR